METFLERLGSFSKSIQTQGRASLKNFDYFCNLKYKENSDKIVEELRTLKGAKLENAILEMLQDYVNYLHNDGLGVQTIKNYTRKVKDFLAYILEAKIASYELRSNIKYPRAYKERKYPLSHDELKKILDLSGERKGMYLFMAHSGMAIEETCRLRKRDFSEGTRWKVNVPASYRKTRVEKITYLSSEAEPYILEILSRIKDDDIVFGTHKTNPKYSVLNEEQVFARIRKKAGLGHLKYESGTSKISIHSLRSFFITNAGKANFDLAHELAGHDEYKPNTEYNRYDDKYMLEFFLKAEPHLLVYDKQSENQEEMKKEITKMRKRIEDLEFGVEARESMYSKNMLMSMVKKDVITEAINLAWAYLFEKNGTEEEKRERLKKLKKANDDGEIIDVEKIREALGLKLEA